MHQPKLIYLTAAGKIEGIDKLVALRPDLVAFVERTRLDPQPPKPPMRQVAAAGASFEATLIVLATGIQITVTEPVSEVKERVNEALGEARPRRWWLR